MQVKRDMQSSNHANHPEMLKGDLSEPGKPN